jgi:hypothetical protein
MRRFWILGGSVKLAILFLAASIALLPAASESSSSSSNRTSSAKSSSSRSKVAKAHKAPKAPKVAKASKAHHPSDYCTFCERDSRGRIKRGESATNTFRRLNPCPATGKTTGRCSGYVIDHIVPLKGGGPDAPFNMQWQTKAEAKAKDRAE